MKRNFTIDAGVRFYYLTPTQSEGDQVAAFEPEQFDRRAGAAAVPAGHDAAGPPGAQSGDRRDPAARSTSAGWCRAPATSPTAWRCTTARRRHKNPFKLAPRIGFAWDVTGDGKTAVRGGAGVFYDRYSDDNILDLVELPPLLNTFTTNYTTMPELLASPADRDADRRPLHRSSSTPPVVYNWSLGVQRDIGWNFVGDAAYVGNAARNQRVDRPINGRPYGYAYQASSLDPTNVDRRDQRSRCPTISCGRTAAMAASRSATSRGYSDYHSLQFSVNRRRIV